MKWHPSLQGNFQICILVEEYRNGIQIGEIRRDMQAIVVNDSSYMMLSPNFNGNPSTPLAAIADSGFSVSFNLSTPDSNVALDISAHGEPFLIPGTDAKFIVKKSASKNITGSFSWTPAKADIRSTPYRLVVRAEDGQFSYDYTLLLSVSTAVSLPEMAERSQLEIYPNPSSGNFHIGNASKDAGRYQLHILDLTGKIVYSSEIEQHPNEELQFSIHLADGEYILNITSGENAKSGRLLIRN